MREFSHTLFTFFSNIADGGLVLKAEIKKKLENLSKQIMKLISR